MKRVFFTALSSVLLFTTLHSFAQNNIKDGDYIKNEKVNKFIGTWQWVSKDTLFILVFRKGKDEIEIR